MTTNSSPDVHADSKPATNADRDTLRKKAQSHFSDADARTALVKEILENERAAFDARTAKLRALRLAKEVADREAGKSAAKAPSKTVRRRTRR